MRNRDGLIVGLTCRVGRAMPGSANLVADVVLSGRSILLLGRPGVGKTTAIRDISRMLAVVARKRVVIIDTSNEIAGDGNVPHHAIASARRMQVCLPVLRNMQNTADCFEIQDYQHLGIPSCSSNALLHIHAQQQHRRESCCGSHACSVHVMLACRSVCQQHACMLACLYISRKRKKTNVFAMSDLRELPCVEGAWCQSSSLIQACCIQVPVPEQQHRVTKEAVEHHMPMAIVINEIGNVAETLTAPAVAHHRLHVLHTDANSQASAQGCNQRQWANTMLATSTKRAARRCQYQSSSTGS